MGESADILSAARQAAEEIKNSRLYRDYRRSWLRVEEQPELAYQLRKYKKTQVAYEYKCLRHEGLERFEEEKSISHMRAELVLNEDARTFLDNEQAFLDVYRQVVDTINEACEIDLFNI